MSTWDKGPSGLLGSDQGLSFWQPQPTGGWATLKFTPGTLRQNAIACITQMVPPGGVIPCHAHRAADTIIYVMSGRCSATVDGTSHRLDVDATVVVGRQVPYSLVNDGDEELHLFISITPPGAEDLLAWWGIPRTIGELAPAAFDRPEGWAERARLLRVMADDDLAAADPAEKGAWRVVSRDASPSYWQPAPSRGFLAMKVATENYPSNAFAAGEQMLSPGALIVPHAHTHNEEVLLVTRGRGQVMIDGVMHPLETGSLAFVGRWVTHSFINSGDEDMHIFAILTPPVRDFVPMIKAIGRPRTPGEIAPEFAMENFEEVAASFLSGTILASPDVAAAHIASQAEPAIAA